MKTSENKGNTAIKTAGFREGDLRKWIFRSFHQSKNSSGWLHAVCTCGKKMLFLFPFWRAWMTVIFFWWLESSDGLSQRFCYGAGLYIGGAVLGKKRILFSTFFVWHFFCQGKLFFRHEKSRFIADHVWWEWVWLPLTCDSETEELAAPDLSWHWCPSNVASTKTRLSFEQSDCFAIIWQFFVFAFYCQTSSLALQCNPVCT